MDITIIIPTLNRVTLLERTLRTIPLRYPLIVVDNGSTDGTLELAHRLAAERNAAAEAEGTEARTTVMQEQQPGAAAARNLGLAHCTTEWVYFFDSDDEFTELPARLAQGIGAADVDMWCMPVTMVVNGRPQVRAYLSTADVCDHILSTMLGTPSTVWRTSWLRDLGGWNTRCSIWDDWELGIRALLAHPRLKWLTDEGGHHRIHIHPESLTGPSYSARAEAITDVLTLVAERLSTPDIPDRVRRAFTLRCAIVQGMFMKEGDHVTAERIAKIAPEFPNNPHGHLLPLTSYLLSHYVSLGGRGAWRIARCLVGS